MKYATSVGPRSLLAVALSTMFAGAIAVAGCGSTKTASQTQTATQKPRPKMPESIKKTRKPTAVPIRVPRATMEPTIPAGSYVWVRPFHYTLKVGEIVVFWAAFQAEQKTCGKGSHRVVKPGGAACSQPRGHSIASMIKRIVAGPGDVISIVNGHVIRNGVREPDSYIRPCGPGSEPCNFPAPIKIPRNSWFVMGDNRGHSNDSRFWGPVLRPAMLGVVRWCGAVNRPCPGAPASAAS